MGRASDFVCLFGVHPDGADLYLDDFGDVEGRTVFTHRSLTERKRLQQQNKEGGRAALLAACKRISLFIAAVRLGISFELHNNAVIAGDEKLLRLLLRTLKQRNGIRHIVEQRIIHFFVICHAIDLLFLISAATVVWY